MRRIAGAAAVLAFLVGTAGCADLNDSGAQARQPCGLQAGTPAGALDVSGTRPTEKFRKVATQVGQVISAGDEQALADLQEPDCGDPASTAALARVYRGVPVAPVEFHEEFSSVGPAVRYRVSCPDGSTRGFWLPFHSDGNDLWPVVNQDLPAVSADAAGTRPDASSAAPGSAVGHVPVDSTEPRAGTWPAC